MSQEYLVASLNVLVLPTTSRIISRSLKVKGQMTEQDISYTSSLIQPFIQH